MSDDIRIAITIDAPPSEVWSALTQIERFKQWFHSCRKMELELKSGGKALFSGGSDEGSYVSEGRVLDCIENRKLFHTVLEGHEPVWYGTLLWYLEPVDDTDTSAATRVILSEAGFQAREEDTSDIEEGWRSLLLSLCRFVENKEAPDLPEEYPETGGQFAASSTGYCYASPATCWNRLLQLHGLKETPKPLDPCALIGDLAPPEKGILLDMTDEQKIMYTWPEQSWESAAVWLIEDMGSEVKIELKRWGFENRPDDLESAQQVCDEIMDRLIAGLDSLEE